MDPRRVPWFDEASPGLLTSKAVRSYLSQYSQHLWPLVVKLTLLHGIQSIQQQSSGTCLSVPQLQQLVESGACGLAVQKNIPALQRQILTLQHELDTVFDSLDGKAAPAAPKAPAMLRRHRSCQSFEGLPADAAAGTLVHHSSSSGGATTPASWGTSQQQPQQQQFRVPVPPGAVRNRGLPRRRSTSPVLAPKPSDSWRVGEPSGFTSPPRPRGSPLRRSADNQGATNPIYPDWWGDPAPRPEPPVPPPPQQRPPPRLAYTYRPAAKPASITQDDLVTAEYLLVPGSGYGQHTGPLVPGDGPDTALVTITPEQQQQGEVLSVAVSEGGAAAASGGGSEAGAAARQAAPLRKTVRYSHQVEEEQQQRMPAAGAAPGDLLLMQQQQQQRAAGASGAGAAGGRQLQRTTSSGPKRPRVPQLWAVESRIKADVVAAKQQAAARRAARQRAFQAAMASSGTFPQLRSSTEALGAPAAAGAGLGAEPRGPATTAAAASGAAVGGSHGPLSIAESFLANPLSAWFMGEGPAPGAAPGVGTHVELAWATPAAAAASATGAAPDGDAAGSDASEQEVLQQTSRALQDITSSSLNPDISGMGSSSGRLVQQAGKPPGQQPNSAWLGTPGGPHPQQLQENEEGQQKWWDPTAAAAGQTVGGRGYPRRRWDGSEAGTRATAAASAAAGGKGWLQTPLPPPGRHPDHPHHHQQQAQRWQRRAPWAADYGHLDMPGLLEQVEVQQEAAAAEQEHTHQGGRWVHDFGHLEGPRFSRETAFQLGNRSSSSPQPASHSAMRAPEFLPAGTEAPASSGLFLSHEQLQEVVQGALEQAVEAAGGEGSGQQGGAAAEAPASPLRSSPSQRMGGWQPVQEEEEETGDDGEVGWQQQAAARGGSWLQQHHLDQEEEEQEQEEEEAGDGAEEEESAATAAQLAVVQEQLDQLMQRLKPAVDVMASMRAPATAAATAAAAVPTRGPSRPVSAQQLQQRLLEAESEQSVGSRSSSPSRSSPGSASMGGAQRGRPLQGSRSSSPSRSSPGSVSTGGAHRGRPLPGARRQQPQPQNQQMSLDVEALASVDGAGAAGSRAAADGGRGGGGDSVAASGSIDQALLQMVSKELVAAGWRPEGGEPPSGAAEDEGV